MTSFPEVRTSDDNGCRRAKARGYEGKCLECPFDTCFEDVNFKQSPPVGKGRPKGSKDSKLSARNLEIYNLYMEGRTTTQLMNDYKLCQSTIRGIIQKVRASERKRY